MLVGKTVMDDSEANPEYYRDACAALARRGSPSWRPSGLQRPAAASRWASRFYWALPSRLTASMPARAASGSR